MESGITESPLRVISKPWRRCIPPGSFNIYFFHIIARRNKALEEKTSQNLKVKNLHVESACKDRRMVSVFLAAIAVLSDHCDT